MTAIALDAVLTQVSVVLAVAGTALLGHLYGARRFAMAFGALQLCVRPQQGEVCILRMIESPQRPTVRRMAACAFRAQSALVHVVLAMAIDACRGGRAKRQRCVALRAADDPVQPQQRENRQVMIEKQVGPP